jgi:hypothetical protein
MAQFPVQTRNYSFLQSKQTGLRHTQPPIQWVPEALSLSVKQLEHEADHSPPSRAEAECNYTSTPHYAFMGSTQPTVSLQLLLHYDVLIYFTKTISSLKM